MKYTIVILLAIFIVPACTQHNNNTQLQTEIDSLQKKQLGNYRPGLGEFMLGIQLHHAKLWFAGQNKNWKLADFEVHEIGETLDDIKKFCTDRPEVKSIGMIDPAINSIDFAIKKKDAELFRKGFIALTTNCNNCHKDNQHGFNVITIPSALPVTNQDFKPLK